MVYIYCMGMGKQDLTAQFAFQYMQALVIRTQDPNGKSGFTVSFNETQLILNEELKIWLPKYKDFHLHSSSSPVFLLFTDIDQGIAIPSGYNKKLLEHFLAFETFGCFVFSFFMNYKALAGTVSEVPQNTLVPTVLPC